MDELSAGVSEKCICGAVRSDEIPTCAVIVSCDLEFYIGLIRLCEWEPIVEVSIGGSPKVIYGKVSAEKARQIVEKHVLEGETVSELVVPA